MEESGNYPIGQQDFKKLRDANALYIDKTAFIEKIAKSSSFYYFLVRPHRFGKSLFLSTLQYFFEGKRELFRGLYADKIDWNWEEYPVIRIDLNSVFKVLLPYYLKSLTDRGLSHAENHINLE